MKKQDLLLTCEFDFGAAREIRECNFDLKGDHRSTRKGLFSLIGIRQKTTNH